MGYERIAIPLIGRLVEAYLRDFPTAYIIAKQTKQWTESREQNRANGIRQDSPNHRDMFVMLEVGRAAAWGTKADYDRAAAIAHRLLDLHLTAGLWTSEQCTGRPHGGMYLDATVAGIIGAVKAGDGVLLARLMERVRAEVSYMVLTADDQHNVVCCGERMPKGPRADQQTAWLCEMMGWPLTLEELVGPKGDQNLKDDAWVSLRGLRALKHKGVDFPGVRDITAANATFPFVARQVKVFRWDDGHLASYVDKPTRGLLGVCDWAQSWRGKVDYGVSWTKPLPPEAHIFDRIVSSSARSRP